MKEIELKVNKHFLDYVNNWDYSTYLLIGSYGSSKSYETATKIILKLLKEKRKCLVVRATYEQIKESCYDLMYEILDGMDMLTEEKGKAAKGLVIASKSPLMFKFPNGSRIIFKGMDKPQRVKSINDVTIVWMEECSEVKYEAFKELNLRLRHPNQKIHYLLTTNPVDKQNWVFKHFFENKEVDENGNEELKIIQDEEEFYKKRCFYNPENKVYYHHSVPEDNTFLTLDYIEKLDALKTYDPDLYRVARLGRFGVNGRKVLPQFQIAKKEDIQAFKAGVARGIKRDGFDFGFETSYNALVRTSVDLKEGILYIYDEWYRNHLTDKQTAEKLVEWNPKVKEWRVKADCAQPSSIKYFRDEGFGFTKCHKISRLEQVKKIKRFKKIICSPKCKNTIRELKELVYAEDSNGELIYDEFNIDPHTLKITLGVYKLLEKLENLKWQPERKLYIVKCI